MATNSTYTNYKEFNKNLVYSKIYPSSVWKIDEKTFYRLKSDGSLDKKIFPNEEGFIIYLCAFKNKQVKKKASTFMFEFFNFECPNDSIVVYKDLNSLNYVPENVFLMTKIEFKKLKDSIENLEGAAKIIPHKTDAFSFVVVFKMQGKTHKKTCHDIVTAQRIKQIILYKSTKFLNKHIVTG